MPESDDNVDTEPVDLSEIDADQPAIRGLQKVADAAEDTGQGLGTAFKAAVQKAMPAMLRTEARAHRVQARLHQARAEQLEQRAEQLEDDEGRG